MGWICKNVGTTMRIKDFGRENLVNQSFGRLRRRLRDNIKINLRDISSGDW
jgi:hypothetical protein